MYRFHFILTLHVLLAISILNLNQLIELIEIKTAGILTKQTLMRALDYGDYYNITRFF